MTVTDDGYALTNIKARYVFGAPRLNEYAAYSLSSQPQGCAGGEFFVAGPGSEPLTLWNGLTSTPDWRNVSFRLPPYETFVQVMYGDPDDAAGASFVASVSLLMP
ncbi:hypothetical protein [Streptomyces sp. NPDC001774]